MTARIYINKRIQPIFLERDRAIKLKNRKFGLNRTPRADPQEAVDLGTWAGQYSEIKSIDLEEETRASVPSEYSVSQLIAFHKRELQKYLTGNEQLTLESEMQMLSDKKFIAVFSTVGNRYTIKKDRLTEYRAFANILDAWKEARDKRHYAKGRELEELDEIKTGIANTGKIPEEKPKCVECGVELPKHLARYCSGMCMQAQQKKE